MKERDAKDFIADLRRSVRKGGLKMEVDLNGGKGSHIGIIIRDPKAKDLSITLIIPGHKNLSPGVQREIRERVKWLAARGEEHQGEQEKIFERTAWWAARIALIETVREILERVLNR